MSSVPVIAQTAGPGAARAASRRRSAGKNVGGTQRRPRWVTYTILGIVLLISVFPLYFTLILGSSTPEEISRSALPQLLPDASLFDRFADVMSSDAINFWKAAWNSVVVAVLTSLSVVLFSTLAGFSFSKLRFRGRGPLLVFVIATMAVPTQLGVIPMYILMSDLGWIGKLQAVIVPALVTAFGVFWMTQYLGEALPYELIEAARVDGASMIRTFWSIALPAARPAAAMLGLFTFVQQWTNFFWPSIVLNQNNPTLPLVVRSLQSNFFVDYSLVMAGIFLVTLPLIVIFIFTGRQLVAGIMQGAVKG
ncbi:cellobiose ABC transporter membrane protein [Cellulosimicrobium aquatile]|uniref:Carbohydrate ABC transporter permease n=2 Tax=Cellulosimicrobium TaxID=157920 RepID=A0A4Y8R2A9_9MICO|nr:MULTISPECIES: carbohydrate ABC transporter permease [Cellulosimicrobium]TGA72993.1 carbohydrate ABC transporter permease [Cellulosimicrobium terreum]MCM3534345.1 carbohydrate ABC transporter permease [Cellulosimicrobium funkei]MDQ8042427.1 carbohydrate ABC transporter permease [Cellulosimicrobium sp. XJ-DQ-B-000]QUB99998.1 carbohydrate ABC transporter permease [Cellulosimicrobium cellulans]TFF08601.1 carbohydrate ABC transporter permease [Cellulosimicrobium funkei]